MKLIVPYTDEMDLTDIHLVHLAEFCGIPWEKLPLERCEGGWSEYLEVAVQEKNSCFVVNPAVVKKWLSAEVFPSSLASYLVSRFPFVVVHNLYPDPFCNSTVRYLSGGCFQSVHLVEPSGLCYKIASDSKDVCGAFSNLVFGPINRSIDRVLVGDPNATSVRLLASINERPFFAGLRRDHCEVFFLAAANIVDLDSKAESLHLTDYFSQLVPPVMLFRHVFREACWQPNGQYATLIIDDPLLRRDYGFLNYRRVLKLMDRLGFHVSIAFIPYNFRRTSPNIARVFRDRPDRYSLCFHGNNHTAAEFGLTDLDRLNAILQVALSRMDSHQLKTGIKQDRVMVFPQGVFSVNAMIALKANNFLAAVNTGPHPQGELVGLSVADIIQPAIMRFGGFPLFQRKYVSDISQEDIAFNLFFGKPVLIVEHHEIFKDSRRIIEIISSINSIAPQIRWTNLQTAIENSYLRRRTSDGTLHVQAYAGTTWIQNESDSPLRCAVLKRDCGPVALDHVLVGDQRSLDITVGDAAIRFFFDLAPTMRRRFSIVYRNELGSGSWNPDRGFRTALKVFLRRRLSEMRDNYLSKNPGLRSVARFILGRLTKPANPKPS